MGRSWSDRWARIRGELTLTDLMLDVSGKMLLGFGLGVWLADAMRPYAWLFMVGGVALSALVKAKHWKRFWM